MQSISFCRYYLSAMSQYFIWFGVNHLSLCDFPNSRFYAGYRYNVAIIDIDGESLLSLTSSIIWLDFLMVILIGSNSADFGFTSLSFCRLDS